jgi:hypothetical protein
MRPLIDTDVLLYEVGFASETRATAAEGTAFEEVSIVPKNWDFAKEVFDNRIKLICDEVEATEPPLFFLTESALVNRILNKKRKFVGEPETEYVANFRDKVAVTKEYKGNRKLQKKPFHYKNLANYVMCGKFDYHVATAGLEADDALCIYQNKALAQGSSTIICSRDKDLRQCKGWHYSWECAQQGSLGPLLVDELGSLINTSANKFEKNGKPKKLKVLGTGSKFFYYQLLTGDSTDNIVGIMGKGPSFAYNLLRDAVDERECYELVAEVYVKTFGDVWEEKLKEMADLLYIIKNVDEEGNVVKWTKPKLMLQPQLIG